MYPKIHFTCLRMFGKMQHKVEGIRNSVPICQVYENKVIFVLISTEKEGGRFHTKAR